jgi:hypothetical protein
MAVQWDFQASTIAIVKPKSISLRLQNVSINTKENKATLIVCILSLIFLLLSLSLCVSGSFLDFLIFEAHHTSTLRRLQNITTRPISPTEPNNRTIRLGFPLHHELNIRLCFIASTNENRSFQINFKNEIKPKQQHVLRSSCSLQRIEQCARARERKRERERERDIDGSIFSIPKST